MIILALVVFMKKIIYLILFLLLINTTFALEITNISFNPSNEVESGRALLTTVRVQNIGEKDEENIKVEVNIPDLGLSASDYIDEIGAGESKTSEELYMRIPECVEAKDYSVKITVEYDEEYETVSVEKMITVTGDVCAAEEPVETDKPDTPASGGLRCPSICGRNSSSGECICPSNYGFCFDKFGLRDIINNTNVYCNNGLWQEQKEDNQTCNNNFECKTNFCSNNFCYDISKQVEKNTSETDKPDTPASGGLRCPSICGRNSSSGECICPSNYGFCQQSGLRNIINETSVYCISGLWFAQKEDNQTCQNSFECLSNFCSKGICYDISKQIEENKSILQSILDWIKRIFGL